MAKMEVHDITLEKVLVTVQKALAEMGLACLRDHLRAEFIQDHLSRHVIAQFQTWAAGGSQVPVCFSKEVSFTYPATWWDAFKEDVLRTFALERGWAHVADWLDRRIKRHTETRRVSETKYVSTRICPHLSIPDHRGESIHVAWLDGRELSPWKT